MCFYWLLLINKSGEPSTLAFSELQKCFGFRRANLAMHRAGLTFEFFEGFTTIELGTLVQDLWRKQNACEWGALVATSRIVALLATDNNLPDPIVNISLAIQLEAAQPFLKSKPNHNTIYCFLISSFSYCS